MKSRGISHTNRALVHKTAVQRVRILIIGFVVQILAILNEIIVEIKLKLKLGKELECTDCRNARISREIDEMNMHFSGEFIETE